MLDMHSSSNASPERDDASRESLLQQILASRHFKKSPRLKDFLRYVCECALAQRFDEISEQQIALNVFGRSTDYSAAEDTIVRTAARQLRQKLELYSLDEGADGEWCLSIPKGSYIPVFERRGSAVEPAPSMEAGMHQPRRWPRWPAGAAVACALLVWGGITLADMMEPHAIFWRTILASREATQLVSGDSGLPILESETHHVVHVREYAAGKLESQTSGEAGSANSSAVTASYWRRRYTSVADLMMAVRTAAVAEKLSRKLELRYARDISLRDLKSGNAILVGGAAGNPWVELFSKQLNFDQQYDEPAGAFVVNRAPVGQEDAVYHAEQGDKAYAVVALTSGLDGHSRVLLLEGSSVAGTDAAVEFLFNSPLFSDVLKSAVHGWSVDDFEVLLETENVVASGTQMKVIGVRVHRR